MYVPGTSRRSRANAAAVAKHLESHPLVSWVRYPGLASSPYHAMAQKYLPKGAGAVFSFGLKGGFEAGKKFVDSLKVFSHLANVGDAKSLILHPASTSHSQLTEEQQRAGGLTPDLIRLSIGLEHPDDLIDALDTALASA